MEYIKQLLINAVMPYMCATDSDTLILDVSKNYAIAVILREKEELNETLGIKESDEN